MIMRVVVNIPSGSHPELLKELEMTRPRDRAERLRMLATFGLIHISQPSPALNSVSVDNQISGDTESLVRSSVQKTESIKASLKSKLRFD